MLADAFLDNPVLTRIVSLVISIALRGFKPACVAIKDMFSGQESVQQSAFGPLRERAVPNFSHSTIAMNAFQATIGKMVDASQQQELTSALHRVLQDLLPCSLVSYLQ